MDASCIHIKTFADTKSPNSCGRGLNKLKVAEVHLKRAVIFTDRFSPDILSTLKTKGEILHLMHIHFRESGL